MIRRIGFPCVMSSLPLSTNHNFRLASLSSEKLASTVERNLEEMETILEWMSDHGMKLFRIGSSLVPFASHPAMEYDWPEMAASRLAKIGRRYSQRGFRFSLHPGQYNVLNSENPNVVKNTVAELLYSCQVLDLMGLDSSHKVVLHGGCRCGDMAQSKTRLIEEILKLPKNVRSRLVLENDERIFSAVDIVEVCESSGLPAVFDIYHNKFLPSPDLPGLLKRLQKTWQENDGRPKLHLSSQKPGGRDGAHGDMVLEEDLRELCETVPFDFDLMVEAKLKEKAILEVVKFAKDAQCILGQS
jgi:UV DNA damage endonuclease